MTSAGKAEIETRTTSNSFSLSWETYEFPSEECPEEYIIKYRTKDGKWSRQTCSGKETQVTIGDVQDNTEYEVKVFAVDADADETPLGKTYLKTKCSLARSFMSRATKIEGHPALYSLDPLRIEHKPKGVRYCYFESEEKGKELGMNRKTIMVLGETGTGKSTLVDAMFNYLAGVSHADDFRFQLVHLTDVEKKKADSKFQSLTDGITCYHVPENSTINFRLCLIDTPGFGDTRGESVDKTIVEQVEYLFNECIDSIDAICLVVPTACVRLTKAQTYVFKSIKELFGKDAEKNFIVLLTKDDGASGKPEVLQSIKAAGINIDDESYFRFNNANLFKEESSPGEWLKRNKSFQMLFEKICFIEPMTLCLTREVLKSRTVLEIKIKKITEEITRQLTNISNINSDREKLKQNENEIKENKNFENTRKKEIKVKEEKNFYSLNCRKCRETCHSNCMVIWSKFIWTCEVMDDKCCTICPQNCSTAEHKLQQFIYTTKIEIETETLDDMKRRYQVAKEGAAGLEEMLGKTIEQFKKSLEKTEVLLSDATKYIKKLKEVALEQSITSLDQIFQKIDKEDIDKNDKEGKEILQRMNNLWKERGSLLQLMDLVQDK